MTNITIVRDVCWANKIYYSIVSIETLLRNLLGVSLALTHSLRPVWICPKSIRVAVAPLQVCGGTNMWSNPKKFFKPN